MNVRLFFKHIATQGAVGYGEAPGTIATVMSIPFVWFLGGLHLSTQTYLSVAVALFLAGWLLAHIALPFFKESDPPMIVIDEMVCFIALFCGVPVNLLTILVAFVLFRLLDIYKPCGIAGFQSLPGAAGVMCDDAAAALITHVLLKIFVAYGLL